MQSFAYTTAARLASRWR